MRKEMHMVEAWRRESGKEVDFLRSMMGRFSRIKCMVSVGFSFLTLISFIAMFRYLD